VDEDLFTIDSFTAIEKGKTVIELGTVIGELAGSYFVVFFQEPQCFAYNLARRGVAT